MRTFSETVQPIVATHSNFDLRAVLELLGTEVQADLNQLEVGRRAELVDRLVRNLRGMSVAHGPGLERDLLRATGAEPSGTFSWELTSATALIELRTGLKYLATWLGFEWADISRLQATICGLARWIHGSGTGSIAAAVEKDRVRLTVRLAIPGFDAKTVETSAFVVAVRELSGDYAVSHEDPDVVLSFSLLQR